MSTTLDINTPQGAVDYIVEAAVTTPGRDRWEQVGEPTIDYAEASEIALDQARLGWTVRVIERHIVLSPITVLALHRKRLDDEAAERKAAETAADEARRKEQDDNAWSLEHGATNGQHFGLVGEGSGAWESCPRCAPAVVNADGTPTSYTVAMLTGMPQHRRAATPVERAALNIPSTCVADKRGDCITHFWAVKP